MKTESIAVHYFYPFHHGVDPSFSEDGETFHCTRYNSVFDVAIAIASYALDLFFYLLAYLHPSSEERTLRHLFLQAAVDCVEKIIFYRLEALSHHHLDHVVRSI